MDRKPQIQPQRYPPQKNFNRNYIIHVSLILPLMDCLKLGFICLKGVSDVQS